VPPVLGVPNEELAPEPAAGGGVMVELNAELGGGLGALDDPELPVVDSDWATAANGHERAIKVAIQCRLEIMYVVQES